MDKVRCPWCGEKMFVNLSRNTLSQITYQHKCTGCNARGPERLSEDEARAAALQRWVEPNRVLTLEEVMSGDFDYFCIEQKGAGLVFEDARRVRAAVNYHNGRIDAQVVGDGWRPWLRRPTDEERENTPWD